MHESKTDGYIRGIKNALNGDEDIKAGISLTHEAAKEILELLKHPETLSSAQPKIGKWMPFDGFWIQCSKCGAVREKAFMENYCPNCGAKMTYVPDTNDGKMSDSSTESTTDSSTDSTSEGR